MRVRGTASGSCTRSETDLPSALNGVPDAMRAATGAKTSLPWNVTLAGRSPSSAGSNCTASTSCVPASTMLRTPLSGATNVPSGVLTATNRRRPAHPRIDHHQVDRVRRKEGTA